MRITPAKAGLTAFALTLLAGTALMAASTSTTPAKVPSRPAVRKAAPAGHLPGWNSERNAYFGDLHVHTKLSFDAYIFNVRATPDDAYRFARGETIGHAGGFDIRLAGGPLDFVAVTDHSEYMGAMEEANNPQSPLSKLPIVDGLFSTDPARISAAFNRMVAGNQAGTLPKEFSDPAIAGRAWREVQDAAARNNMPGRFTTLVGYEYTSAPDNRNLHRNVIFRTAKVPELPFTATMNRDPEELWRHMDAWRKQGIESLAIPHNGNGSDGLMYQTTRLNGQPMDKVYADLRARNEPLTEITQTKGASETHPTLSPNDEWADFEIMESYIGVAKKVTKFDGGYVRKALKDGILMQELKGYNPFKLGFVGGTDTHNAAPGSAEEVNYFSKVGRIDGLPVQRGSVPPDGKKSWEGVSFDPQASISRFQTWGASGLAGVWAEENSREAIYAALRRRETFATSGPRIRVRFFASYDFPEDVLSRVDGVTQAYARGVPMGGDLLPSKGNAPTFMVWAVRDPRSAYLQRAQIVKGWVENGQAKEKVFDVACSDKLALNTTTWRCPGNGAGVNLANCEPTKFKGDVELKTLWRDPEFNPKQRAFYYLRVIENPTCRWSTWDAIRNGTPPSPYLKTTVQERAWSSPIWYEPAR
ncbi:MAG TPA: DUF3604 domain-containing protein [Caulobacteraceae bacterium]|nr:DUF3604 domain-containing protein [Caulobacteraceae bacterium]